MLVIPACALSASLNVALVLSSNSAPYQEFVAAFNNRLADSSHVSVFASAADYSAKQAKEDIVVTVGMLATETLMADIQSAMLPAMVPQPAYESLLKQQGRAHDKVISAIYLNQPWDRQVDFLFAVLPQSKHVGVLNTVATRNELHDIDPEIKRHGAVLVVHELNVESQLSEGLDNLLHESDVLLAVPDSAIYSPSSIRNILLSTYRKNVPLLGWSQAFVNAGAVAAIYSTPEQIAQQAAEAVLSYQKSGRIAASQYPAEFNIAVNRQVSRSLGLVIPSEAEIRNRMKKGKNHAAY
ncbi:MAG: ABC transporter substrate binding protein [Gallionella sp.]|nr:ABC transporter substrate binding protein [Gallionella sp.]